MVPKFTLSVEKQEIPYQLSVGRVESWKCTVEEWNALHSEMIERAEEFVTPAVALAAMYNEGKIPLRMVFFLASEGMGSLRELRQGPNGPDPTDGRDIEKLREENKREEEEFEKLFRLS